METLFIVDSLKDIDKKISIIMDNFGEDIKFFVSSKLVAKISTNKVILGGLKSIYGASVNDTITQYIKSKDYTPQDTILYYSSAELDFELAEQMREAIKFAPPTVYFKKHLNWFGGFKVWCYNKIVKSIVGMNDEFASTKFQFMNAELMGELAQTSFKNHILSLPDTEKVELSKEQSKSFYDKVGFNKNFLYCPIAICLVLMAYVILEAFVKVKFWMYLSVILILVAIVVCTGIFSIKAVFDKRYRK